MSAFEDRVLSALEFYENGDPMSDVLESADIIELVEREAQRIKLSRSQSGDREKSQDV